MQKNFASVSEHNLIFSIARKISVAHNTQNVLFFLARKLLSRVATAVQDDRKKSQIRCEVKKIS